MGRNNRQGNSGLVGFQGMTILGSTDLSHLTFKEKVHLFWKKVEVVTERFVKTHSDLGLCHVAAYHKSYSRASNDVMCLMEASGTKPILYDDISTRMCTSISKAISTIVVIIIGQPLSLRSSGLNHATV